MSELEQRIQRIAGFKQNFIEWSKTHDAKLREWLNQNKHWVEREVTEAGCSKRLTIHPPPAVGGLIMNNVNPFNVMFDNPYLLRTYLKIAEGCRSAISVE
jgi:hypothetical protein